MVDSFNSNWEFKMIKKNWADRKVQEQIRLISWYILSSKFHGSIFIVVSTSFRREEQAFCKCRWAAIWAIMSGIRGLRWKSTTEFCASNLGRKRQTPGISLWKKPVKFHTKSTYLILLCVSSRIKSLGICKLNNQVWF